MNPHFIFLTKPYVEVICEIVSAVTCLRAGMAGTVSKISAFRPQGPQFDPRLSQDLN